MHPTCFHSIFSRDQYRSGWLHVILGSSRDNIQLNTIKTPQKANIIPLKVNDTWTSLSNSLNVNLCPNNNLFYCINICKSIHSKSSLWNCIVSFSYCIYYLFCCLGCTTNICKICRAKSLIILRHERLNHFHETC